MKSFMFSLLQSSTAFCDSTADVVQKLKITLKSVPLQFFPAGSEHAISSWQDGPLLSARVANQNR